MSRVRIILDPLSFPEVDEESHRLLVPVDDLDTVRDVLRKLGQNLGVKERNLQVFCGKNLSCLCILLRSFGSGRVPWSASDGLLSSYRLLCRWL